MTDRGKKVTIEFVLEKLVEDISKSTGLSSTVIKETNPNLHKFEREFEIKIQRPKRNAVGSFYSFGRLGYHRHKLYDFIPPDERKKRDKLFDEHYGISLGEFRESSED